MKKRENKIEAVAHEHRDSLLLATRLQQGEKALARTLTYDPINQAQHIVNFYDLHLAQHFEIEENILFPLLSQYVPTASTLVKDLTEEHRKIAHIIDQFRQEIPENITTKLREFGKLLEEHIHTEDEQLFPMFDRQVPSTVFNEIEKRIQKFYEEHRKPSE